MDKAGIYEIYNKVTNKRYVGSSVRACRFRWAQHLHLLKENKHHSPHLQNAWNKHGEENFEFKLLEEVNDKNIILEREQYWLDFYNSSNAEFGYNTLAFASSPLGFKHTDETKLKMSISAKGKVRSESHRRNLGLSNKGRKVTDETRLKIGLKSKGRVLSEESRLKISIANKGKKKPPRTEEHIKNLSDAHRGHKLTSEQKRKIGLAHKGKIISDEQKEKTRQALLGIPRPQEVKDKVAESNRKYIYTLISPDNQEFTITNLRDFCKEYNLNRSHLHRVSNGYVSHHKKWKMTKQLITEAKIGTLENNETNTIH